MPQQVLQYPQARKPSELCSITFLRYALFCFTTVLLISSLALLSFGIWTWMEKMESALLFPAYYSVSVYGIVAIGGVVFFSGIIGCHGTIQEKYCSLILFTILLIIILAAEIAVGVISYSVYFKMTDPAFKGYMSNIFVSHWGTDEKVTEVIDHIQMQYKCCGSQYYKEWLNNTLIKDLRTKAPDSCCISPIEKCGRDDHVSNLHQQGCIDYIMRSLSLTITVLPAMALGFSILQIIGVLFSISLARQILRSKRTIRRKYTF